MVKRQSFLIGFALFLLGSILFWSTINESVHARSLKAGYFVGIICLVALSIFQFLNRKITESKKPQQKVSFFILFALSAAVLYYLIVYVLKLSS